MSQTTNAKLVYTATVPNAMVSGATIQSEISQVPLPTDYLQDIGCVVSSDSTVLSAGVVTRTVNIALVPSIAPAATAAKSPSVDAGPIVQFTVTNQGKGLAGRQIIEVTDELVTPTRIAIVKVDLEVDSVVVDSGGTGYTQATVAFVGKVAPGGQAAAGTAAVSGGSVTGVTVTQRGDYVGIPRVVITGNGSGALAHAVMRLQAQGTIIDGGDGYQQPVVSIVGAFKYQWPDGVDQTAPFRNLITAALQAATAMPIVESAPVIT